MGFPPKNPTKNPCSNIVAVEQRKSDQEGSHRQLLNHNPFTSGASWATIDEHFTPINKSFHTCPTVSHWRSYDLTSWRPTCPSTERFIKSTADDAVRVAKFWGVII